MDSAVGIKWATYFLIKCDDSYVEYATEMINELLSLKISNQVSFSLCVKLNRKNYAKFIVGDANNMITDDPSPENTTIFFKMETVPGRKPGNNHLIDVQEDRNFDLTDPGDLAVFFRYFSKQYPDSCKNILLTWDHGKGYSMFYEEHVKNVDGISIGQLNKAIQQGFGGKKTGDHFNG